MKVKDVKVRLSTLKEMSAPCSWSNCKSTITKHVASYAYKRSVSTHEHAREDGRPRTPQEARLTPARVREKDTRTMHLCAKHRANFARKFDT